jgi:hypothetical protein
MERLSPFLRAEMARAPGPTVNLPELVERALARMRDAAQPV